MESKRKAYGFLALAIGILALLAYSPFYFSATRDAKLRQIQYEQAYKAHHEQFVTELQAYVNRAIANGGDPELSKLDEMVFLYNEENSRLREAYVNGEPLPAVK